MEINVITFETAKLLKDFGFDIICPKCYGVAVMHNGEYLGYDEECELRAEGRDDEYDEKKDELIEKVTVSNLHYYLY